MANKENLGQIPMIANNISRGPTRAIRTLHKFMFGHAGDRGDRQRLREFTGFEFTVGSENYEQKVSWAVKEFKLGELIAMCQFINIDYEGTDETVVHRLCSHLSDLTQLRKENEESVSDSEENNEDEDNDNESVGRSDAGNSVGKDKERNVPRFTLSSRDIEDAIHPFDGYDCYSIEAWIDEFESNAKVFGWSDMQKLLFARKTLKGLAQLFVRGERDISTWKELKFRLLREFSTRKTSADLHQMLSQRKIRRDEKVYEYFLSKKEIASRGNIETEALIQYIADGVTDDFDRRARFYESRTLQELKNKLR